MRILCLNANTTQFVTETVAAEMRATLGDAAQIVEATARFGPNVIKTRLENAVAMHGVTDAAARHGDVDAILLAVSFDTGREALREALSVPVIGMSEATVAMARLTGGRIGYISMGADTTPLYFETLTHCDLGRDRAGWETVEAPAAYRPGDKSAVDTLLTEAAGRLAGRGADVVVLLGAVLAGAARRIQPGCAVPVLDGGRAGALMARAMADLAPPKPETGSYRRRPGSDLTGVDQALAALRKPT